MLFSYHADEEGEHMMILVQGKSGCWTTLDGVSLKKNKHKDIVMFELDRPIDRYGFDLDLRNYKYTNFI